MCSSWPRGPIDSDFHAPLHSDVPVLLLSGSDDPVTPPAYAETGQARTDPQHARVLQGFGHGQLAAPCVDRLMANSSAAGIRDRPRRLLHAQRPAHALLHLAQRAVPVKMIEASNLQKHFGRVTAVRDVSLRAADGRITGLLGPNGAGKSTTLRILYTVLAPDAGDAFIDGVSAVTSRWKRGAASGCYLTAPGSIRVSPLGKTLCISAPCMACGRRSARRARTS